MTSQYHRPARRLDVTECWKWILILTILSSLSSPSSSSSSSSSATSLLDAVGSNDVSTTRAVRTAEHNHPSDRHWTRGLPSPLKWRNRPIYIQADEEGTPTRLILDGPSSDDDDEDVDDLVRIMQDDDHDGSLPLGVPIPFESDIFKGQILFRIRNIHKSSSTSSDDNDAYFGNGQNNNSYNNNRLWQFVVQGRFKESIPMNELYTGEVYDKPLVNLPSPMILRQVGKLLNMVVPGIQFDIASKDRPRVLTLYGGTVQTMRKDLPGTEPNIRLFDIDEETSRIQHKRGSPPYNKYGGVVGNDDDGSNNNNGNSNRPFATAAVRKRTLSNPELASQYVYDTDHVYTWDHHDNVLDYGTYMANLFPGVRIDLTETLNGQPMTIGAVTQDGRWMFRFKVYHERQMLQQQQQQQQQQ